MKVLDIPLQEVMEKYLDYTSSDFSQDGNSNRTKTLCPFHDDTDPSLVIYDNTSKGGGYDYHCFVCKATGNAVTMLTTLGLVENDGMAVSKLQEDFGIILPEQVTIDVFADLKGLDQDILKNNGWQDDARGILVPFYNEKREVIATKVRCKYQGKPKYYFLPAPNDIKNPMYGLHWLPDYTSAEPLYICEGETDALTMRQAGYQVLGVTGVNAWKSEFSDKVSRFPFIVIAKDNDEHGIRLVNDIAKDIPDKLWSIKLPDRCKDVNDLLNYRCKRNIDNFIIALEELGLYPATPETFLASFKDNLQPDIEPVDPDAWDMLLRALPQESQIQYYIQQLKAKARVNVTILKTAYKEAKQRMAKQRTSDEDAVTLTIQNNCYYKTTYTQRGTPKLERITNYIIHPLHTINSDGTFTRIVQLINEHDETSHPIRLTGDELTNPMRFAKACIEAGNYIFQGNQTDLIEISRMLVEQEETPVLSPNRIGRIAERTWLFGNCGIDSQGQIHYRAGNIIELDGKKYTPRSIYVDDDSGADMPMFPETVEFTNDMKRRLAVVAKRNLGTYGAWLALGWCYAGWFSNQIFEQYGFYPYLFVAGKRNSGKTTLCKHLYASYGFDPNYAGKSIETPSNVGILRNLTYRCSLPMWYDDYRNVKKVQNKDGILIDVYNRHGATKGLPSEFGLRAENINGFLLLSGEDVPSNNALLTRCVIIQVSQYIRDDTYYAEFDELARKLKEAGLLWAASSLDVKTWNTYRSKIEALAELLQRNDVDARSAYNYAIFAAGFMCSIGALLPAEEINDFLTWLIKDAVEDKLSKDTDHPIAQFFNDMVLMKEHSYIAKTVDYDINNNILYLRLSSAHTAWSKFNKDNRGVTVPLKLRTLRDYLKNEPCYIGEERFYMSDGRYRCVMLDLEAMAEVYEDFYECMVKIDEF